MTLETEIPGNSFSIELILLRLVIMTPNAAKRDNWLHRTEYFKYAVQSDVLFLAVDGGVLASGDSGKIEAMVLKLVAALQVLIETRGVSPDRRLSMPVAVLILKADLLEKKDSALEGAINKLQRLIALGETRCRHFKVFHVSAIGLNVETLKGAPPQRFDPDGVLFPMLWALRHFRRSS